MRSFFHGKFALLTLAVCLFPVAAAAQTRKPKPKPLATPPPVISGAEIISRADDPMPITVVTTPAENALPVSDKPVVNNATRIKELTDRIEKLEGSKKNAYDEKQKRMVLNLDILTKAEQRSEGLRKQLFELIEKENSVKSRLDQIDIEMRPESIERALQLTGSMKPEEVRENRRRSLASEKANLQSLLANIQSTNNNLSSTLQKSDIMVEKLRTKLEKDIDDSFLKDDPE